MFQANLTSVTFFFFLGFSHYPKVEVVIFALCLLMYLISLLGNIILISITILDSHLHKPMYFFLSNLAFLDIWYTSSAFTPMLTNFVSGKNTISFLGCATQMYFSLAMGATECVLLSTMAYDRYVAICNPLRYPIIMNKRVCVQIAAGSWMTGCLTALVEAIFVLQLSLDICNMERTNDSMLTEFVLVGLSAHPKLQTVFFVLVLWMYLMILLGNGILILVIIYDSHLHTPMYFFLCNLSFLDICYTSSSVPLILDSFLTGRKRVSFSGCMVQMFLSFAMGATECVLLGMMALDRYVAICYPLRYPIIMSKNAYLPMAAGSWITGLVDSVVQTSLAMQLPFCTNNVINHFVCEIVAILKLACADISINVISMTGSNLIVLVIPLLVISISYIFIVTTILRIPSTEGKRKAFSTCSAHLT
ncbi:O13C8 protein, partial [Crocuta crocuta]